MTANLFRSKHLVYKPLVDTEHDKQFIHSLRLDSEGLHRYILDLPKPVTRAVSDEFAEMLRTKQLITAVAYLPGSKSLDEAADATGESEDLEPVAVVNLKAIPALAA